MAWLTGWNYRKLLKTDHNKIDSDCSDFPVKVILDGDNFDFSKALSTGYDIRFTSSDGETLLKHEREIHQVGDTPTGYANATYETSFNGSDEYYSLPSAANLHKPYQVLEVEFTANAVNKDQNIVFLEMANRAGAAWFSLVKERSIRLGITSEGKLSGYMECSNTGTFAYAYVTSSASLSADTKYSAKLVIDNNTKSLELYLDGQLQDRNTVTHAQTWIDISAYIWCDLGILFDYHSTSSTNHARYFDGTIHSYNLMAQNTLMSAVYHVKLPTASSTSDTEFYCYYGKSDATDGADGENVWDSNYALVHHMGADCLDSTSNDNDGTNSGTTLGLASDGYYRTFDGTDDYIYIPNTISGSTQSIELYFKENAAADWSDLLTVATGVDDGSGRIENSATSEVYNWARVGPPSTYNSVQIFTHAGTAYDSVAVISDGTSAKAYKNGEETFSVGKQANLPSSTYINIGKRNTANYWKGDVKEIRFSSSARSDAWIKATYHSLADTLLTYGSLESVAGTPRVMVVWA